MRQEQTQDGFWRGILQRETPRGRSAGYVPEGLNLVFRGGIPSGRPALRPFHGERFAAPIRGMGFHVRADGSAELLVAAGTVIQTCFEGGDPETVVMTNLPAANQTRVEPEIVTFLSLSGGLETTFIFDGVNENLKWDDTNLTVMGLPVAPIPDAPVSVLTAGLINRAGKRLYKITLNSEHHEGPPTDSFRDVTCAANKQYTFVSPVRGVGVNEFDDPQVLTWKLYGTIAGGGAYLFIGEADIGTSIIVNLSDDTLGVRDPLAEFVNFKPPAPAVAMAEHRGQLAAVFIDDLGLVRFSFYDEDYMVPEGWPENYVQPVAHGDGDRIAALASNQEWLMVLKTNGTFAISGESFEDYRVVPVLAAGGGKHIGIGCYAAGTVLCVENAIMFASRDGIYKVDRFATATGGIQADRLSGAIDNLYTAAKFSLGATCFFDRTHRVFCFLGHG